MTLADTYHALWTLRLAIQHILSTDPGKALLTPESAAAIDLLEDRYDALMDEYHRASAQVMDRVFDGDG